MFGITLVVGAAIILAIMVPMLIIGYHEQSPFDPNNNLCSWMNRSSDVQHLAIYILVIGTAVRLVTCTVAKLVAKYVLDFVLDFFPQLRNIDRRGMVWRSVCWIRDRWAGLRRWGWNLWQTSEAFVITSMIPALFFDRSFPSHQLNCGDPSEWSSLGWLSFFE